MLKFMERATIYYLKQKGWSSVQIAEFTGPHRDTIAKVLKEEMDLKPKKWERTSAASVFDPQIHEWLEQGLPVIRMFEQAWANAEHPYTGCETAFYGYVRKVRRARQFAPSKMVIRFEGMPGEYLQIDWGEVRDIPLMKGLCCEKSERGGQLGFTLRWEGTAPMHTETPFKWRHFEAEIILLCVRWYLRQALSYRDLAEMMAERGLSVEHTTIYRGIQHYAPELEKRYLPHLKITTDAWRVDETQVKVKGVWAYLYRAVDAQGKTLECFLSPTRDAEAAKRFFAKAGGASHTVTPRVITVEKNAAYPKALNEMKAAENASCGL